MKIVKVLFSIIFLCLFAIALLTTVAVNVANSTISQEYIMNKLEESGIYEELEYNVQEIADVYIASNPENKELFEEFSTKENIKELVEEFSKLIYTDTRIDSESIDIELILRKNINSIADTNDIKFTEEQQNQIDEFINVVTDEYNSAVNSSDNNKIGDTDVKVNDIQFVNVMPITLNLMKSVYSVLLAVSLVLALIIIILNLKNKFWGIDYLATAFLFSGIGLCCLKDFLKTLANESVWISKQNVTDNAILKFVTSLFKDLSKSFGLYGTVFVGIGLVAIVVMIVIHIYQKQSKKSSLNNEPIKSKK